MEVCQSDRMMTGEVAWLVLGYVESKSTTGAVAQRLPTIVIDTATTRTRSPLIIVTC